MSSNQIFFPNFLPAEVRVGNICRIVYHAKNPQTDRLERFVVKCNRLHDIKKNTLLAKKICHEINIKLAAGWNPFIERDGEKTYKTIIDAVEHFLKEKKKELRKEGYRSYSSFINIFSKWLKSKEKEKTFVSLLKKSDALMFLEYVYIDKEVSGKTYNNYLLFFSCVWNWLVEKEYCKTNIFRELVVKKKQKKEGI